MRSAQPRDRGLARFAIPALGVLGVALILLLGINTDVWLSWDSANYLSAARSLVAGEGLILPNGTSYPAGPLFPFLLAAGAPFGIDAVDVARYVNAAAFGLTVFTTAAWLHRRLRSPLLAVWAGAACLLMPVLYSAAASVWTEIVFILFTMAALSLLDRFLSSGKAPALLLAAAAAAAACLTRYIGAALIGAGALILLLRNGAGMRARLRDAALWSVVSLAPISVWMVRNLLVLGVPLGSNAPSDDYSGLAGLHLATGELAVWLFGATGFDVLNGAFGRVTGIDLAGPATVAAIAVKSILLAAPVLGAGYALARYRPRVLRAHRTVLTVTIGYAAAYSLVLLVYLWLTRILLPVRYLLPLFPPLLVAATLALDGCLASRSLTKARVGTVVVAAAMSLWLVQHAGAPWLHSRTHAAAHRSIRERLRARPSPAIESDVIRFVRANQLDGIVWSSEPWLLYLYAGQRGIGTTPGSLAEITDHLANLHPATSIYVVLFDYTFRFRNYGYGVDDLRALPGVDLVADLGDGAIFHRPAVVPAPPAENRVVRAYFDIHVYEDALAYFREPCTGAEVQADFFLRVVPAAADLSAGARAWGANFNNLDFSFAERGVIQDGRCLAVLTFDYRIARFHTGQSRPGHPPFWEVEATVRDAAPVP